MQQANSSRPHVIANASHILNVAEPWLSYGYPWTAYTDRASLQLFKGKILPGRLDRWFLTIDKFNPTIKYLPCNANATADTFTKSSCF